MRLGKFLKFIGAFTFLALIYIHLQMQIIDLAYQGKYKEKQINKLVEQKGNLTYSILTLKSASHLGNELLKEKSGMRFAAPEQVVRIFTSKEVQWEKVSRKNSQPAKNAQPLLSLLSFGTQAEAKPRE